MLLANQVNPSGGQDPIDPYSETLWPSLRSFASLRRERLHYSVTTSAPLGTVNVYRSGEVLGLRCMLEKVIVVFCPK